MVNGETVAKRARTLKILWVAMLGALTVYLCGGLLFARYLEVSIDPEAVTILRYSLYALVGLTVLLTPYVRKRVLAAREGESPATTHLKNSAQDTGFQKYTRALVIAWALSESIGVYGVVLFLVGRNPADLYGLFLVAAVAMWIYRPKEEEIARFSQGGGETTTRGVA